MFEPSAAVRSVAGRAAQLRDRLLGESGNQGSVVLGNLRTFEAALDQAFKGKTYFRVQEGVRSAWNTAVATVPERTWAASLLADLIAQAPQRLATSPVPAAILPHIASEFSRIVEHLEKHPEASPNLGSDLFLKDLALCRLGAFPCVAQIADKNSGISRALALRGLFRAPREVAALGLHTRLRFRPFFELHTHLPMLKGFTPKGWDLCYVLLADLLQAYPEYEGIVGSSWFWDPQLDRISPGLSFLRDRPLSGGAFLLPLGQPPADIADATASGSRRKLYLAGEYRPMCWSLVWPRASLLRWVEMNRDRILETTLGAPSLRDAGGVARPG
jgi:hypothetical protein